MGLNYRYNSLFSTAGKIHTILPLFTVTKTGHELTHYLSHVINTNKISTLKGNLTPKRLMQNDNPYGQMIKSIYPDKRF